MTVTRRAMELATATAIVAFGGLVIGGSLQLSTGWGPTGPESGYVPFRLGILLTLAGGVLLAQAALARKAGSVNDEAFATVAQLRQSLALFLPTFVLVLLMPWVGCYLASALYIAYMARALGSLPWPRALGLALAIVVALYGLFELWFQVPLAKGPIEEWLGIY